jgi:hypothetical protein
MADNVAPPKNGNAKRHKSFAAGFSNDTNLAGQSTYPAFAPQVVDFHNAGTSEQNAVYTTENGDSVTQPVAPGQTYPAEGPVKLLKTSGANISALAHWYNNSGYPNNA